MKRLLQLLLLSLWAFSLDAQNCAVQISFDSTNIGGFILTAHPSGTPPFTYLWDTGETSVSITSNSNTSEHCVSITDANGCIASGCIFSPWCEAYITTDPAIPGLSVVAWGAPPFTYTWSSGQTTENILPNAPGFYCVTITAADGCTASTCYNYTGLCGVSIGLDSVNTGGSVWYANAYGTPPFSYFWHNGDTTQTTPFEPNQPNAYVYVTDANGCIASDSAFVWTPPACLVYIQGDSSGNLSALSTGNAPFAFQWSSGETTQSITPENGTQYCVTVTDATGCTAYNCYYYACYVTITLDSIPNPVGTGLYAAAWGALPLTYQWNVQNASSPSIIVSGNGNYCVTVTDANGCESTDCINLVNGQVCELNLYAGNASLFAAVSGAGFTFLWSTGETTQSIIPSVSGNYCVTVTSADGTCIQSGCIDYTFNGWPYEINGSVIVLDSLEPLQGIAELVTLDPATGLPTLLQSVPLIWSYYRFTQVAPGSYIVKVSLDPAGPQFDDYLPTYYGDVLYWDEATAITMPSNSFWYSIKMIPSGGSNGPGIIGGTVTDGNGLVANGEGERGGDPLPGVSVLLLNDQLQPVYHAITDDEGKYGFSNLAYGTYKVVVEITGHEQGERWVTLNAQNPASDNNDFEVTEEGILNEIADFINPESGIFVSPNPAKDFVKINVDSSAGFEAQLQLSTTTGSVVLSAQQHIGLGEQTVEMNLGDLPSGVYFLQFVAGNQVITKKIVKE